jgi:hypothetical protein
MARLDPGKLHTPFGKSLAAEGPLFPRCYTLTHSDLTGDLFLTIAPNYNRRQTAGWYTRLMRDEVLAAWEQKDGRAVLHVHCHVSGGWCVGSAGFRDAIFQHELPLVLEALRYGDRRLFKLYPDLEQAPVWVHFHARQKKYNRVEDWGPMANYG